jgi:hypothetical protein
VLPTVAPSTNALGRVITGLLCFESFNDAADTLVRGYAGSSMSIGMCSRSPCLPLVPGRNPSPNGNAMLAGSTRFIWYDSYFWLQASLLREPFGA